MFVFIVRCVPSVSPLDSSAASKVYKRQLENGDLQRVMLKHGILILLKLRPEKSRKKRGTWRSSIIKLQMGQFYYAVDPIG